MQKSQFDYTYKAVSKEEKTEFQAAPGMDLAKLWSWKSRKLASRIRTETGNPAGDDIREIFAELAGGDNNLREMLSDMKNTRRKQEQNNKLLFDYEGDKIFKEVLNRSHIIGATEITLKSMEKCDEKNARSSTNKNIGKQFNHVTKSPPKRILLEIQRERSKPLRLPDQDEHKEATAKLEKKLAKQRAARMAAIDRNVTGDEKKAELRDTGTSLMATVLPAYDGDKFGSSGPYLESMLYLSRMPDAETKTQRSKAPTLELDMDKSKKIAQSTIGGDAKISDEDMARTGDADDTLGPNEQSSATDIGAKLYCAAALCNWSRNAANANRLASEGAVRAIMQLFLEPNQRISMFCAAAFRFMSEHTLLANSMIEDGAIKTMSDIIGSVAVDDFICSNFGITLVNLTRISGRESQVVDAGIVLALQNLMLTRPELSSTCARGLYNLTCVDSSYPPIDRVIRALISLSSSGTANVKHICAAALCNLADLKSVRPRLVEEGTVNVLGTLSKGAETRTRRVCAVILQNLSAAKSCRVDMTSRNSVTVAYSLSSDQDPIILRCIGLTLSRLAMEPVNCSRIIFESGITALCNIAVKYPAIPGISQPVAVAFQLLSSRSTARITIVEEGSVTAIASLLRMSVDLFTLQHSLLALCNMLSEPESHLPIVQQGLIITLIALSSNDNDMIKDFCSLSFLNLSRSDESRKHIVNSGAIVAITALAKHKNVDTKRRCAAALCNISCYEIGMGRMVSDGIIPALVTLVLAEDMTTVHCSCSALCRLCSTVEYANLILESGAIPNLVQRVLRSDVVTKQFCGAVLSSLSYYDCCTIPLCEYGMIDALKILATLNDDITKQRCLVAYANLSCEPCVQAQMIQEGVVKIIADLAESYQEVNYICCAKAMCNLACNDDSKLRVASEGGVYALLMISMVHSVDKHTKLLCVLALTNLLDESTLSYMLNEGIVGSLANLSKIPDARICFLCCKLFNQLSFYPDARAKFVDRPTALTAIFGMLDAEALETKVIAARTICNLVLNTANRTKAIEAGALRLLDQGIVLPHEDASLHCVQALFSATSDSKFLLMMAQTHVPTTIVTVACSCSGDKYGYCVKTLAMLSWEPKSRVLLQNVEFSALLMKLVETNLVSEHSSWLVNAVAFLTLGYKDHTELINVGICSALYKIFRNLDESTSYSSDLVLLVQIVRTIAQESAQCASALATRESIAILLKALNGLVISANFTTIYNAAVVLYNFAASDPEARLHTSGEDTLAILKILCEHPKCAELAAATLSLYVGDSRCRNTFANEDVGMLVVKIMDYNPVEDALNNAICVIYSMSKIPQCRDFLSCPPLNVDSLLLRYMQHSDSLKIKANCGRVLKNLTSDPNEAIEEGAVAALISMSLEGKAQAGVDNEVAVPHSLPQKTTQLAPPDCSLERIVDAEWFDQIQLTKGGAAGKGPDPPMAPVISEAGSAQYASMSEEIDCGDMEGKTKMAFAKMQVSQDLRAKYILTDRDFDIKPVQESSEVLESGENLDNSMHDAGDDFLPLPVPPMTGDLSEAASRPVSHAEGSSASSTAAGKPKSRSRQGQGQGQGSLPSTAPGDETRADTANSNMSGGGDAMTAVKSGKSKSTKKKNKEVPISEKAAQLGIYN